MASEPKLTTKFTVVAYNEAGLTGYGDNASRDFDNEKEAINYAKSLDQKYYEPSVWKRITMEPISIKIDHTK